MFTGIYEIAGVVPEIRSLYREVQDRCADYRSDGIPSLTVEITQSHIDLERQKNAREAQVEGIPQRHFSDGYLETLAAHLRFYRLRCNMDPEAAEVSFGAMGQSPDNIRNESEPDGFGSFIRLKIPGMMTFLTSSDIMMQIIRG